MAVDAVDDKYTVSAPVGTYRANPWGLHDMHIDNVKKKITPLGYSMEKLANMIR